MGQYFLSVIIPAYNEENRLASTLESVQAFLKKQPYSSEIIVVDDGSRDQTIAVAKGKLRGTDHRILENKENRGKGYTVKRGMLAGEGDYLLFCDADLSTPIEEASFFLEKMQQENIDVLIGSRALKNSRIVEHQPLVRESMGRIYNFLARLLAFHDVSDSQCGFKCFSKEAAQDLFARQTIDGFSFDAEIVYLAQKRGYVLKEEAVTWRNSPQTKVRFPWDPINMFLDLVRIRWAHRNISAKTPA